MINLIINEFKKLFSKKSTYIIFLVVIIILVGINYLNKSTSVYEYDEYWLYDEDGEYKPENIMAEIEKNGFPNMQEDEADWRSYKYEVEQRNFAKKLKESGTGQGWKLHYMVPEFELLPSQNKVIELELEAAKGDNKILESVEYKKAKEAYENELDEYALMTEEEFTERSFKEKEEFIEVTNTLLTNLKEKAKKNPNDKEILQQITDLETKVRYAKHDIEILNIRKEKNIPYYQDNYMNQALLEYDRLTIDFDINDKPEENTKDIDKSDYYRNAKILEESSYVLETGHEINNLNTGNHQLSTFLPNYMSLFLVAITVIAGTIVAEEYSKGTIKNLLVVPYKRGTILLAKLITVIFMAFIMFIVFFLAQILISGILYDFKTMADPVVFYSIRTESIQSINLFYYVFREFALALPQILVYAILSFALSTITTSSTVATSLGIISIFVCNIINQLILFSTKTWIKYIPTINWDWNAFISENYYLTKIVEPKIAIPITIITFLVLLIPTFIVFKKRDIKNI